ncbi:MAG: phosphatase PAP2 family protein [Dehalococcoidia bacterium]
MAVASSNHAPPRADPEQGGAPDAVRTPSRLGTIAFLAPLGYVAVVGAWLVHTHNWPTSDEIALSLFALAAATGRGLGFLRDWSPFILLVLAYEALRGFAGDLSARVHVQFPISADRALFFGHLPTNYLQAHLWDPNHLHWYDYLSAYLHAMHFVVPLAFAFVLWLRSGRLYWKFVASYLLLSYAGFVTYMLFPMAPPWWASNAGSIPHVDAILDKVLWQHSVSHPIVLAYRFFDSNPVAAMPSLHAAFPVLVWLVVWKLVPRYGWLAVAYPLAVSFAVVYMGEHYVVDVLAGWLYGASAFAAVWILPERWRRLSGRLVVHGGVHQATGVSSGVPTVTSPSALLLKPHEAKRRLAEQAAASGAGGDGGELNSPSR